MVALLSLAWQFKLESALNMVRHKFSALRCGPPESAGVTSQAHGPSESLGEYPGKEYKSNLYSEFIFNIIGIIKL